MTTEKFIVDDPTINAVAEAIRRDCNTNRDGFVYDHPHRIAALAVACIRARKARAEAAGRWTTPTIKKLLAEHYPKHIPTVVLEEALRDRIKRDHGVEEQP